MRAVARGDVIKGRKEGKGWGKAGEVGEEAQTQLCGPSASASLILNGRPLHWCASRPGAGLSDELVPGLCLQGRHTAMLTGLSSRCP